MLRHQIGLLVALLLLQSTQVHAQRVDVQERLGDLYEMRLERVTETSGDRSSGSSHDVWTLTERVVALRDGGVELEFDLPLDTSPEDRARTWQYPVRVFHSAQQPLQLLNGPELQTRIRPWLERFGLTEALCGRWTFTWTAFKIECDPYSVLRTLEAFDLRPSDLREGALYHEAIARSSVPLRSESRSTGGLGFVAEMEIDPEVLRRERAASDVIVAEILGNELNLNAALQAWAGKQVSGSAVTTFETNAEGRVVNRTRVTRIVIIDADGSQEHQTTTETLERRFASSR